MFDIKKGFDILKHKVSSTVPILMMKGLINTVIFLRWNFEDTLLMVNKVHRQFMALSALHLHSISLDGLVIA